MITYYLTPDGWKAKKTQKQCPFILIDTQCQGAEGHSGEHWHYSQTGSYHHQQSENSNYILSPVGSDTWVSPIEKGCWKSFYTVSDVVDPETLRKLNADELDDDNVTIIKPVVDPKILRKLNGNG